jgi:metallo-beta-lactamase family protein
MKIRFLGATRTVTGSRFLLEQNGFTALLDCGLFQGAREWKARNWDNFPVDPSGINCVILTHAHIDHSGYLPRFILLGFSGPIYCTPATSELLALMLPDSGRLQEEDAAFANKTKYTTHDPALPLYTEQDAFDVLKQLMNIDFYSNTELVPGFSFTFLRAGHILGSGMVEVLHGADKKKILFTGDLGRPVQFITKAPDDVTSADVLVCESTYGNRLHEKVDVRERLAEIIRTTAARGGVLLVPAFAIGRTQELLFILRLLEEQKLIPQLPVYIDSPMAIQALPIYDRYQNDFSKELEILAAKDPTPFICHHIHTAKSRDESKEINNINYPAIIISASGMATGGRILHHLKHRIGDHRNTVLFIGFQAEGTKGRFLVEGAQEVKIHGQIYPVRAQIVYLDALSAHVDYEELLVWLEHFKAPPQQTFLVHGEAMAASSLAEKIRERFGWNVRAADYLETAEL